MEKYFVIIVIGYGIAYFFGYTSLSKALLIVAPVFIIAPPLYETCLELLFDTHPELNAWDVLTASSITWFFLGALWLMYVRSNTAISNRHKQIITIILAPLMIFSLIFTLIMPLSEALMASY